MQRLAAAARRPDRVVVVCRRAVHCASAEEVKEEVIARGNAILEASLTGRDSLSSRHSTSRGSSTASSDGVSTRSGGVSSNVGMDSASSDIAARARALETQARSLLEIWDDAHSRRLPVRNRATMSMIVRVCTVAEEAWWEPRELPRALALFKGTVVPEGADDPLVWDPNADVESSLFLRPLGVPSLLRMTYAGLRNLGFGGVHQQREWLAARISRWKETQLSQQQRVLDGRSRQPTLLFPTSESSGCAEAARGRTEIFC